MQLRMDYNLCLGAHLLARLDSLFKIACEVRPAVAAVSVDTTCRPQHSRCYLVAWLYEVRCGTSLFQCCQTLLGVFVYLHLQLVYRQSFPRLWQSVFSRVCPCVRVVEVEHESLSVVLYPLSQFSHVVQRLVASGSVVRHSAVRIYEETYALSVPSVVAEELQHVALLHSALVLISYIILFIYWQHRDVAAKILCLRLSTKDSHRAHH